MSLQQPPLALYIHFPWCVKKCPYCDFNSHPINGEIPAKPYAKKIIEDLGYHKDFLNGREIKSIFLGGGTPSAFPSKEMKNIFEYIFSNLNIKASTEITLEANPGTIERNHFKIYRDMGINRVSIGAQSFQNKQLSLLGRIHNASHIYRAIDELVESGFDNFNIDIMHGLPKQTVEQAINDLEIAISLKPKHISWYQLTLEPKTVFYNNPPELPNEDVLFEIEKYGKDLLSDHKFHQYEVSAYSYKNEFKSQHNLNYWKFGDYIGVGAGAHSKITNISSQNIVRMSKYRSPKRYINSTPMIEDFEIVSADTLPYEFMMNILRIKSGFTKELFETRTGLSYTTIEKRISLAMDKRLLKQDEHLILPTNKGHRYLNDLITLFL